jgi:hypothetical protein
MQIATLPTKQKAVRKQVQQNGDLISPDVTEVL